MPRGGVHAGESLQRPPPIFPPLTTNRSPPAARLLTTRLLTAHYPPRPHPTVTSAVIRAPIPTATTHSVLSLTRDLSRSPSPSLAQGLNRSARMPITTPVRRNRPRRYQRHRHRPHRRWLPTDPQRMRPHRPRPSAGARAQAQAQDRGRHRPLRPTGNLRRRAPRPHRSRLCERGWAGAAQRRCNFLYIYVAWKRKVSTYVRTLASGACT